MQNRPLNYQKVVYLPCWFVIVFFIGVIYVLSLEADTMKALMVSPIWFIIFIGYFGFYKPKHK